MEGTVKTPLLAIRNILAGLVFAAGISFASVNLLAFSCTVSEHCTSGALAGYDISCGCMGTGTCSNWIEGWEVRCACDGFPVDKCDCDNGCVPIIG
jgi:hypothetical protein